MTMQASRSILWLALLVATPALAQQDVSKIGGDVQTEAGQRYGDLATVSGDIHVARKVEAKSVHSVSGDITIEAGASVGDVAVTSGEIVVGDNASTGALKTVSGNLALAHDVVVDGGLSSVSGEIFVDRGGKVGGGVTAVSGNIGLVGTEVDGGIAFVSSDVTVGAGSHVKGGIHLKKPTFSKLPRPPRVVIGPNAVVDGPLDFELPVTLYVHTSAKTGAISGATPIAFSTPSSPKD
jgi:hypothetical protein